VLAAAVAADDAHWRAGSVCGENAMLALQLADAARVFDEVSRSHAYEAYLLAAQCVERIDSRRAARREITGAQRGQAERQ